MKDREIIVERWGNGPVPFNEILAQVRRASLTAAIISAHSMEDVELRASALNEDNKNDS